MNRPNKLAKFYHSHFRWIPLIGAFIVTCLWLTFIHNLPVSDQDIYHRTAISVAEGKGLLDDSGRPTAYWAPGYTFYIALFYKLFGPHLQVAFWANALSYLMFVIGVYVFAKELYSKEIAWLAATLCAWYPSFIFYSTILASEIFFLALLLWGLYFCCRCINSSSRAFIFAILGGILFGVAILTRPQALVIPAIILVIGFVYKKNMAWLVLQLFLLLLGSALVLIPWAIRNKEQLGEYLLVSANLGVNLRMGNHPGASGKYEYSDDIDEILKRNDLTLTEKDAILKHNALQFIYNNPGSFLWLTVKRVYWTMRSESLAVVWNIAGIEASLGKKWILPLKILSNAAYYLLLVGVIWGVWISFKQSLFLRQDLILATLLFLLSLPFLIFHGQDRFHLPLIPFLIIFVCKTIFVVPKKSIGVIE